MEIIIFASIYIPVLELQKSYFLKSDRPFIHKKILCSMKDFAVNVIKVQNIFLGS